MENYELILEGLKARKDDEKELEGILSVLNGTKISNFIGEAGGGLSRLLKNLELPFIVITAFRGEYTYTENRKRNAQLVADFRSHKLGGKAVVGGYVENKGTDNEKTVKEESFFIAWNPNSDLSQEEFKNYGISLCKKFNQDAMVYSDGKEILYVDKSGVESKLGKSITLNKDKMNDYWSKLKGNKFLFEGIMEPGSSINAQALGKLGLY